MHADTNSYPWMDGRTVVRSIAGSIAPPRGFTRTSLEPGSFADWLRGLPLKQAGARVMLYNGREKPNQAFHAAVMDIDTGPRDLQQSAGAIIRFKAEYLFSVARYSEIEFQFTSGTPAPYERWRMGFRPVVRGDTVRWARGAGKDSSHASFRSYLDSVFRYAGTASLGRELVPVKDVRQMQIGDVFIRGGPPGHAVIVVDMAERSEEGSRVFMIAQSYMPAQDIHILVNPVEGGLGPWYRLEDGKLRTPEWEFDADQLMRFKKP